MAGPGSRLEKFGTVFSRVRGLLNSGALKETDKPIWYDVYEAHPPAVEPKLNRPVPTETPIEIMYIEDILRAKFYNKYGNVGRPINLTNKTEPTVSQKFIDKYMEIEKSGTEKGRIFQAVEESLISEGLLRRSQEAEQHQSNINTTAQMERGFHDQDSGYVSDEESSRSDSSSDEDEKR